MSKPEKDEIVALALALQAVAVGNGPVGVHGLRYLCREAARMIRRLRPDLAFVEEEQVTK